MSKLYGAITGFAILLACIPVGVFAADPVEVRVLTYNIHHGEGLDGKIDLERIARIIKNSKADLVALQEVDRNTKRSGGVDQAKELGRLTDMHYVFGKAIEYQGGEYGQAILSRWPISSHKVHTLPQRPAREQRIALVSVVESPIRGLKFVSTHLDHQIEAVRIEQAQALEANFDAARSLPSILAGDFNATPESETMKKLFQHWQDAAASHAAPTIPSENPTRRIDYVLLRPQGSWKVLGAEVLDEPIASDHRPVLLALQSLHQ